MKKKKPTKCRPWAHKWFEAEMFRYKDMLFGVPTEFVTIIYICEKCNSQKRKTKHRPL